MEDNKIIIYQDDNEVTRVSVRFIDEEQNIDLDTPITHREC